MTKAFDASRDHDLTASGSNASAWPADWKTGAQTNQWRVTWPYRRTFRALVARHGVERANSIVAGTDEATNADLAAWRQLGAKA